nr:MAG TPA: hypothetical protein [Caudoviricetes sp.]
MECIIITRCCISCNRCPIYSYSRYRITCGYKCISTIYISLFSFLYNGNSIRLSCSIRTSYMTSSLITNIWTYSKSYFGTVYHDICNPIYVRCSIVWYCVTIYIS